MKGSFAILTYKIINSLEASRNIFVIFMLAPLEESRFGVENAACVYKLNSKGFFSKPNAL